MTDKQIDISYCWAFTEETPEVGLQGLRDCGFEGVELWPDYLFRWGTTDWVRALEATGMRVFQLCPYFNFVAGPEKVAASYTMLEEYLEVARTLGCTRLRVFTGPPWGEGVVGSRIATPEQWESAITHLQKFCDLAAGQGVELCLECHEGSLMEDSPSTQRLLDGVNRENLTVNLQLPLFEEDWRDSLAALARHTRHIHIHNWETALGQGELTFLEDGVFDWAPVVQEVLAQSPHRLCLSVEHVTHNGRHDGWETARRDGPYLRRLAAQVAA